MSEIVTVGKCKMCNNYSHVSTNKLLLSNPPQLEMTCNICNEKTNIYFEDTTKVPNNIYVNALAFHKTDEYMCEQENMYLNKVYNAEREGIVDVASKDIAHAYRKARSVGLFYALALDDKK